MTDQTFTRITNAGVIINNNKLTILKVKIQQVLSPKFVMGETDKLNLIIGQKGLSA